MQLRVIPKRLLFEQKSPPTQKAILSSKKVESPSYTKEQAKGDDAWLPLDDSMGEITHIAFTYPKIDDPSNRNAYNKVYMDLVFKLLNAKGLLENERIKNKDPKFQISTIAPLGSSIVGGQEKPYQEMVREVNQAIAILSGFNGIANHAASVVPQGRQDNPSMWLQDDVLILQHQEVGNYSVKIMENAFHQETYGAADTLAASLRRVMNDRYTGIASPSQRQILLDSIPFKNIVGGNILFVGGYALVGFNNIKSEDSIRNHPDDWMFVYDIFKNKFNLPEERVIILRTDEMPAPNCPNSYQYIWEKNNERQPLNHLDLFITPAGQDINGNPRLVIGKPVNPYDEELACFPQIVAGIEQFIQQIRAKMPHVIIYRNPLPLVYHDHLEGDRFVKKWFFASYNNVIVQFTGHDKENKNMIWMPRYGKDYSAEQSGAHSPEYARVAGGDWSDLVHYDQTCRRIFESLGFKVIPLTNYLPFAETRSGPRCLTKIIERNPFINHHQKHLIS